MSRTARSCQHRLIVIGDPLAGRTWDRITLSDKPSSAPRTRIAAATRRHRLLGAHRLRRADQVDRRALIRLRVPRSRPVMHERAIGSGLVRSFRRDGVSRADVTFPDGMAIPRVHRGGGRVAWSADRKMASLLNRPWTQATKARTASGAWSRVTSTLASVPTVTTASSTGPRRTGTRNASSWCSSSGTPSAGTAITADLRPVLPSMSAIVSRDRRGARQCHRISRVR